ncbi:mandelate racemase/muconate lactonizing enzyme family protein [Cerasicoccus arenae]|uniref:N-succinyl-L-Arg/Lys racemase n=2 Tax=Cerasicoccus arenae TaxID=424488 RepID=A0A8J3DEU7_9BACT|nr:enolase C-terminal domain-like protein [Cerasicoccus arenae]GHB90573.1 N-succinyl-L-Arg/Lys racemase [Cerasicoccus arenae]
MLLMCAQLSVHVSASAWTITGVELIEYKIPRTSVFRTAKGSSSVTPGIFVVLSASSANGQAAEGVGDMLPRKNVTNEPMSDAWPAAQQMAELLIDVSFSGDDLVADRATVVELMAGLKKFANAYRLSYSKPPTKGRELRATLCGFDVALLALLGDIYDKPLHEVLGETRRDSVRIAGVTKSLGLSSSDAQKAVAKAHAEHRCVRLKIGGDEEAELGMLRATALAIVGMRPDLEIFVDVNQGWKDASHALEALGQIREMLRETNYQGRFICEQPTREDDFEALAEVTRHTRQWAQEDPFEILIMADESVWDLEDVRKLVALDAVDQINIKIQKAGGLMESLRMAEYLHEKKTDWEVYVGGVLMSDVGAWANHQLGYCLPRLDYMTGAVPRRAITVNPATNPLLYRRGTRTLVGPNASGLGTGLDREALEPFVLNFHQITTNSNESEN